MIYLSYEHDTCDNCANKICLNNRLNRSWLSYLFELNLTHVSAASPFSLLGRVIDPELNLSLSKIFKKIMSTNHDFDQNLVFHSTFWKWS